MLIDYMDLGFNGGMRGWKSRTIAAHLRRLHDVLLACLLSRHWLAWVLEVVVRERKGWMT